MHTNTWGVKHFFPIGFFFNAVEVAMYTGPYTKADAAADDDDHMWI